MPYDPSIIPITNIIEVDYDGSDLTGDLVDFPVSIELDGNVGGEAEKNFFNRIGASRIPYEPDDAFMWFDAADLSTFTEVDNKVSEWRDKSKHRRHATQSSVSLRPYLNTVLGAGVRFDGAQTLGSVLSDITVPPDASFFAVVTPEPSQRGAVFKTGDTGGVAMGFGNTTFGNNGNNFLALKEGTVWITGLGAMSTNPIWGSTWSATGNEAKLYQDGVLKGTNTSAYWSGGNSGGYLHIGGYAAETRYLRGTIHEFLVYKGVVSDEQRQEIEGYLAHKWGLEANLPVDHPYLTEAPTMVRPNSKRVSVEINDVQQNVELELFDDVNLNAIYNFKFPLYSATEENKAVFKFDPNQDDNTDYVGESGQPQGYPVFSDFSSVHHHNKRNTPDSAAFQQSFVPLSDTIITREGAGARLGVQIPSTLQMRQVAAGLPAVNFCHELICIFDNPTNYQPQYGEPGGWGYYYAHSSAAGTLYVGTQTNSRFVAANFLGGRVMYIAYSNDGNVCSLYQGLLGEDVALVGGPSGLTAGAALNILHYAGPITVIEARFSAKPRPIEWLAQTWRNIQNELATLTQSKGTPFNYLAEPNKGYAVDTLQGECTLQMPLDPDANTKVGFSDFNNSFDWNNLILDGNGKPMLGRSGYRHRLVEAGNSGTLTFIDDNKGWLLTE